MTLLGQIVDGASGDAVPVSTLLRKLKVLASRTDTDRLAEWVGHELDGYPDGMQPPVYRGPFELPVLGHFLGSFGSEMRNIAIPRSTMPEDLRDGPLFKVYLLHSVATIEDMASQSELRAAWSADAVRYYNAGLGDGSVKPVVNEGMLLAGAYQPVQRQVFVGVLDAVRTRILDLALELERVAPRAGEADAPSMDRGQAQQVMNTYNFHGASNVAIGSSHVTQTVGPPAIGDEAALLRYLGAAGVPPRELVELEKALAADNEEVGGPSLSGPGSRVRDWMGKASTSVGTGATAGLIVEAIKAFFGN